MGQTDNRMKPCRDHLGNSYASVTEMCARYHISQKCFRSRILNGYSLETALTRPAPRPRARAKADLKAGDRLETSSQAEIRTREVTYRYTDHLGRHYHTLHEMCSAYNITDRVYRLRIKEGWSLEKILTTQIPEKAAAVDHLGNVYDTAAEMCAHYGIRYSTYSARRKKGWTVEKALTFPVQERRNTGRDGRAADTDGGKGPARQDTD